jgi:hypothetical protein
MGLKPRPSIRTVFKSKSSMEMRRDDARCRRWDATQRKLPSEERAGPPAAPPNTELVLEGRVRRAVLEEYNRAALSEWQKATVARANPRARMR